MISDAVIYGAARDGRTVIDLMDAVCRVLSRADVMAGIAEMVDQRFALRERVVLGGVAVLDREIVFAPGAMRVGDHPHASRLTTCVFVSPFLR